MKRWWVLSGIAAASLSLSGCTDFRLNQMVEEYRMTCFGSISNECVNERVEINIVFAEEYLERIEKDRDTIVSQIGEDGYARLEAETRRIIALNEEDRPAWFLRWFVGEGQHLSAPNFSFGYGLFVGPDYQRLYEDIAEHYQVTPEDASPAAPEDLTPLREATVPVPAQHQDAPEGKDTSLPVESPAHQGAEQILNVVEAHIARQAAEAGASEYTDARLLAVGDLNGDGHQDAALVYTLEGAGGGNSSYQRLATLIGSAEAYSVGAETTLGSAAQGLAVRNGQVQVTSLQYASDDPRCCPSQEVEHTFQLSGGELITRQ